MTQTALPPPAGAITGPSEARVARLVRAAQLYYEDNRSQQEIAEHMGVSRASVSRMLTEARLEGMVSITISRPFDHLVDLEQALETRFGLKRAVVVPTSIDDDATMDVVGRAAAELFGQVVRPGNVVGISWGRTINRVVRAIEDPRMDGLQVIQMLGSLGAGDPGIDGHELARRLASRVHAPYRFVSAPAIVETAEDGTRLRRIRAIQSALDAAETANISLYSVGALDDPDTSLTRAGYLTNEERLELLAAGGVGHVLAKIITRDGGELTSFNERVIAVELESLRGQEWSICVASSRQKAAVMLGLLKGGYTNAVVVDAQLADAILRAQQSPN